MAETRRINATIWAGNLDGEEWEGDPIWVEAERTDPNEVAIHTFINGQGSKVSLYFNRESAIDFATAILEQARIGASVV